MAITRFFCPTINRTITPERYDQRRKMSPFRGVFLYPECLACESFVDIRKGRFEMGSTMSKLTDTQKVQVVKWIQNGLSPSQVKKNIQETWGIELRISSILYYAKPHVQARICPDPDLDPPTAESDIAPAIAFAKADDKPVESQTPDISDDITRLHQVLEDAQKYRALKPLLKQLVELVR